MQRPPACSSLMRHAPPPCTSISTVPTTQLNSFRARHNSVRRHASQQQPDGPPSSQPAEGAPPQQRVQQQQLDVTDPAGAITWGGQQPPTRRAVVGFSLATAVALGGNLGGVTSWLLAQDGGRLAARTRLDEIIPVLGFKRCYDAGYGFEFLYPAPWLADQTLLRRAAQRAEASRSLDPPALRRGPRPREVVEPLAAFGPAGSTGEENLSIIVAPIYEGFDLKSLGSPAEAGQQFLDRIAAPPGSDRQAALVAASQRLDSGRNLVYQFEFTIASPRFQRHNVAALVSQNDLLYTLTAQCPQARWAADGAALQQAVASLTLRPPGSIPGRL